MDQGRVVEYDTPRRLLAHPTSLFRRLCTLSGDLESIQRAAFERQPENDL